MQEIWKDINGYDGIYQISNTGMIKSTNKSNKHFNQPFHYLKPTVSSNGYKQVTLYTKDRKRSKYLVHRLVAEYFIPNPHNYSCVNHKDENKLNNNSDNLEWCTYSYNNAYGTARIRSAQKTGKMVSQYTYSGYWIASYLSIHIAAKLLGVSTTSIKDCCQNKVDHAHGYKWKFSE